jgi:lipoprotein-anchoring transpeptidase ErfK/SrfK
MLLLTFLTAPPANYLPPDTQDSYRIEVSVEQRWLFLINGSDTIMSTPVAVGRDKVECHAGKCWKFQTPRGQFKVLSKRTNPVWRPPEWHYYEKGGQVVNLTNNSQIPVSDLMTVEVRDGDAGVRVGRYFQAWAAGYEIRFGNLVFMPPLGTPQRQVPGALGPYALDFGNGYMIHGTHEGNEDSVGQAVSHGCIRMHNKDLQRLYELVPVGTLIVIY